jgi:putative glutamine amidotransferase
VYGGNILRKPHIDIAGNLFTMGSSPNTGMERSFFNDSYVQAVEKAGGMPILLPVVTDDECILAQIESCSGLLFPGGQDINPRYYASETHLLGDINSRVNG